MREGREKTGGRARDRECPLFQGNPMEQASVL